MSNRKPLLSEGTVRRFMKLATLDNLTETFVDTLDEETEELEEGEYAEEEVALEDEAPAPEEMDYPEADAEMAEEPAADVDPEAVRGLVDAIADAIEAQTGVEVSVEGDAAPEEELPMDAEGEPAVEPELEMDADVEIDEEPALEEQEQIEEEETETATESTKIPADLVEELTRRVAARLVREAKK